MPKRQTNRVVGLVTCAAVAATIAVGLSAPVGDTSNIKAAAFFAIVGLLALALAYQMPTGVSGNISFIPFISALPLAPSLPLVVAISLAVLASEILLKRGWQKTLFNTAQYALSISVAILTFRLLGGVSRGANSTFRDIGPFVAGYTVFLLLNTASVSLVISAAQGKKFFSIWKQVAGGAVLYDLFAIPVVYGFGYVYQKWGALPALGVAIPLFGLRQLYKMNYQLETLNQDLLKLIVSTVEARDPYTSGHSERVSRYATMIAANAGVPAKPAERIVKAALLHDVGKIHEEFASILQKPGRLTAAEYEVMKSHAAKGAELVSKVSQFADLVPMIRAHHEAWDGSGYPDGVRGDAIPLGSRIIALADTIDAMSTDRPYRQGLCSKEIRAEIILQSGSQFSPALVRFVTGANAWAGIKKAIDDHQVEMRAVPHDKSAPSADIQGEPTTVLG